VCETGDRSFWGSRVLRTPLVPLSLSAKFSPKVPQGQKTTVQPQSNHSPTSAPTVQCWAVSTSFSFRTSPACGLVDPWLNSRDHFCCPLSLVTIILLPGSCCQVLVLLTMPSSLPTFVLLLATLKSGCVQAQHPYSRSR
jgi:hypothetical protein